MFTNKGSSKKMITFWAFMCRCGRQRLVNHCTWEVARVTQGRLSSWPPPCLTRPSIDSIWKVKNWTKRWQHWSWQFCVFTQTLTMDHGDKMKHSKLCYFPSLAAAATIAPADCRRLLMWISTQSNPSVDVAHKATLTTSIQYNTKQPWPKPKHTEQLSWQAATLSMLRLHEQNKRHKAHVS